MLSAFLSSLTANQAYAGWTLSAVQPHSTSQTCLAASPCVDHRLAQLLDASEVEARVRKVLERTERHGHLGRLRIGVRAERVELALQPGRVHPLEVLEVVGRMVVGDTRRRQARGQHHDVGIGRVGRPVGPAQQPDVVGRRRGADRSDCPIRGRDWARSRFRSPGRWPYRRAGAVARRRTPRRSPSSPDSCRAARCGPGPCAPTSARSRADR